MRGGGGEGRQSGAAEGVREGGEGARGAKKTKKQEKVSLLGEIKCNFTVNLL